MQTSLLGMYRRHGLLPGVWVPSDEARCGGKTSGLLPRATRAGGAHGQTEEQGDVAIKVIPQQGAETVDGWIICHISASQGAVRAISPCVYVCMYVCTYVCMYVCVCICRDRVHGNHPTKIEPALASSPPPPFPPSSPSSNQLTPHLTPFLLMYIHTYVPTSSVPPTPPPSPPAPSAQADAYEVAPLVHRPPRLAKCRAAGRNQS